MSVQIKGLFGQDIKYHFQTFAGGEPHVVLPQDFGRWDQVPMVLDARVRNGFDFFELLAVTDAVKRHGSGKISLKLPYFPGGRQDRTFPNGAFTLKIYADIINAQNYEKVHILDPHSFVTPALINNVEVHSALPFVKKFMQGGPDYIALIAPDAGAVKRVEEVAKATGLPFLVAHKQRDEKTGNIVDYHFEGLNAVGRYLVIDDICDGGATFIKLAEAFHKKKLNLGSWIGADVRPTLDLWVSHGIFSKGTEILRNARYSRIGTTDSFFQTYPFAKVEVFPF